jgi:hypothetical protein
MRCLLLALSPAFITALSFNVSNAFSSHAVLQRGKPVTLWGWGAASQRLTAAWVDGANYTSSVDPTGLWRIVFPPAPATFTPFTLAITSTTGDEIVLADLLLGDVLGCFGQSNMGAVQVGAMANASDMAAQAATLGGALRIFQVSGNLQSPLPLAEFPADGLVPWQPPLLGGANGTLLGFSAVCYIMGAALVTEHLAGVAPVGLLHSSHGGTSIQAWQSPAGANQCGDNSNSWNSSVLYNSNFHPLVVGPLAMTAVYWYQVRGVFSRRVCGVRRVSTRPLPPPPPSITPTPVAFTPQGEQDCGIGATETYWRAQWYGCSLQALILDWRARLGDPALFFVVQQLHAWLHTLDIGLATFRQAQLKALQLPRVALSTAFDGGDPAQAMAGSPGGTVHSHFKFIPGRRAAACLAGALYGLPVAFRNPGYGGAVGLSASNATHTTLTVRVALAAGTEPAGGLVLRGWEPGSNSSHCPTERAVNASACSWFAIQANDAAGSWFNASVALQEGGAGVVLTAVAPGAGLAAVATRNGFSDWPVVTVYSRDGLPLMTWSRPLNE